MKKVLLFIFCMGCAVATWSQSTSYKVYQCYVQRDMATWKNIIDSIESLPQLSIMQHIEVLNYEYGYTAWRLSKDYENKKEAAYYLEKAYIHLHALPQLDRNAALIAAYEGAFIGYQIAISPVKAPFIGMKSLKYVKEAVAADSTNYFAHIQFGNVLYYMPAMFGGSQSEAIKHYKTAKTLMVAQGVYKNNWLYMNLLLTLADAYKKNNDWQSVKACYDEALQLQPNYPYITEKLYPTLQKNIPRRGNSF
jgi:tetratricopeptide (TPR) repeat protein